MKLKVGILIMLLTIITFCGCGKDNETTEDLTTIKSYTAVSKNYENSLSYSGHVAADELKRFSFESAGTIKDILVEKGDAVKSGQVIAELDTETIQMQIDNANENIKLAQNKIQQSNTTISDSQIGLKVEELTLDKLQTSIDTETINLKKITDTYNSAIAKIQLNYDDAKKNYENMQQLLDVGGCSQDALDKAKLALDTITQELTEQQDKMNSDISMQNKKIETLNNDYTLQKAKITAQKNKIQQAKDQKNAAEITLNQTKIALEQYKKVLNDTHLKSTIDGYVTDVLMNAGEVTNAGTPVVAVKSTLEIINVAIPTEDYNKITVGMDAKLVQDDNEYYGKVSSIDLYPDETTRTYNIEIIPNTPNVFALGSLVNVTVSLDKKVLVNVPLSSITNIDGIDYVYCIVKNENNQDIVTSHQVKIEESDGENVYISGIDNGTPIAVDEIKKLRDNQKVKVIGG